MEGKSHNGDKEESWEHSRGGLCVGGWGQLCVVSLPSWSGTGFLERGHKPGDARSHRTSCAKTKGMVWRDTHGMMNSKDLSQWKMEEVQLLKVQKWRTLGPNIPGTPPGQESVTRGRKVSSCCSDALIIWQLLRGLREVEDTVELSVSVCVLQSY